MKKTVLLLFGGESPEHDVSIMSAKNVEAAIDRELFDVVLCYIDPQGVWRETDTVAPHASGSQLLPKFGEKKLTDRVGVDIPIDVALPILHGQNGEDGTIQGVLQLLHVPIAGPDLRAAYLSMDKHISKTLLRATGLKVTDWQTVRNTDAVDAVNIGATFGYPVFVKPSRAGSSVGVHKVNAPDDLAAAITDALQHDDTVLIEKAVTGREIELSVLGHEPATVSVAGEILPGAEFYDYDDKYAASSSARVEIPAQIPGELLAELQTVALKAYNTLYGHGMARVDCFVTAAGEIFVNELNTIPGFTDISMYPKLWNYRGKTTTQLLTEMIQQALSES